MSIKITLKIKLSSALKKEAFLINQSKEWKKKKLTQSLMKVCEN